MVTIAKMREEIGQIMKGSIDEKKHNSFTIQLITMPN